MTTITTMKASETTTAYVVNEQVVSLLTRTGSTPTSNFALYKVIDALTGSIFVDLFEVEAERLARQMAMAQAYASLEVSPK